MALVVLLRGVNVGGARTLRPKLLAEQLRSFDAVNIGAAGTFVVRRPGLRARFRAELASRLPGAVRFVCCEGRHLLDLETTTRLAEPASRPDTIRFVSFLGEPTRARPVLPLMLPSPDDWYVRVTSVASRLVTGEYRRHMKAIPCLGQLDTIFGTLVTTRSQTTVRAVLRVLKE